MQGDAYWARTPHPSPIRPTLQGPRIRRTKAVIAAAAAAAAAAGAAVSPTRRRLPGPTPGRAGAWPGRRTLARSLGWSGPAGCADPGAGRGPGEGVPVGAHGVLEGRRRLPVLHPRRLVQRQVGVQRLRNATSPPSAPNPTHPTRLTSNHPTRLTSIKIRPNAHMGKVAHVCGSPVDCDCILMGRWARMEYDVGGAPSRTCWRRA
jgi:hypothetical protein